MKKSISVLILGALMAANLVNAQTPIVDSRKTLHVGAKLGINYSDIYDKQGDFNLSNPRLGFTTAIFMAIPIGTYIGIQPEIQFSQKGFNAHGRDGEERNNFSRTSNYLDLPVLFALKPTQSLTFLIGPQISILLSQRDVYESTMADIQLRQEIESRRSGKNTIGLNAGLDFNLSNLVFGTRVGWDLLNNNGDDSSSILQYKNIWYQITVGLRL